MLFRSHKPKTNDKQNTKANKLMSIQNQLFKPDGKNSIHDGIEHSPSGGKALIDPTDTVLLLLDHQTGLFQNVKDIAVADLRRNTTALAKLAALIDLPLIITASIPEGPNGPLMPEIQQVAPHAVYVPRRGEVNAWDNALFVKTVRETGKKTLIIAGVWTNVCVMFPALDAKAEGYNVYAVIDASGDPSELASRTTLARFTQAGVIPTSTNAVTCELHRTWNRPDAAQLAELYCMASPSYQAVMESFNKAHEVEDAKQTNNGPKSTRSTTPALAAQSR